MINRNTELFLFYFIQDAIYLLLYGLCIFSESLFPRLLLVGLHITVDVEEAAPISQCEAGRPPADLRAGDEAEADSVRLAPGTHLSVVTLQHCTAPRQPVLLQVVSDSNKMGSVDSGLNNSQAFDT